MRKALGRCKHGHVAVVEHEADKLPEGVCTKGAHPLEEWAVRWPARPA